jgi:hypothetical protein
LVALSECRRRRILRIASLLAIYAKKPVLDNASVQETLTKLLLLRAVGGI